MFRITLAALPLALALVSSPSRGDVIYVPGDHSTIQGAIDAAAWGDVIIVKPGTYPENIDFLGKGIVVKSEQGSSVTTIDGGSPVDPNRGSVVTFQSGETADAVLDGFTITNGTGYVFSPGSAPRIYGGGIYCVYSSPTIQNSVITGNSITSLEQSAWGHGCGIYCYESDSRIYNCEISNNEIRMTTDYHAGAVSAGIYYVAATERTSPAIDTCVIRDNTIEVVITNPDPYTPAYADAEACGVCFYTMYAWYGVPGIANCVIDNNDSFVSASASQRDAGTVVWGGGMSISSGSEEQDTPVMIDSTITNNDITATASTGNQIAWVYAVGGGVVTTNIISNCLIANNSVDSTTSSGPNGTDEAVAKGGGIKGGEWGFKVGDPAPTAWWTISSCDILDNSVSAVGGAVVEQGAAIDNTPSPGMSYFSAAVVDTIVWNVTLPGNPDLSGSMTVTYTDVEGGHPGTGNINADPQFISGPDGDYYLSQTAAGQGSNSPCVDVGDPVSVLPTGTTRTDMVQDSGIVDMGLHYPTVGGSSASATFRSAGSNPASYVAMTLPVLGGTYSALVDVGGLTGHNLGLLVGYSTALTLPLSGGQTLLVNIADSNGELLAQAPVTGPVGTYDIPIPADVALVGFEVFTQALHLGGVQPFALSNAQDLVLGW